MYWVTFYHVTAFSEHNLHYSWLKLPHTKPHCYNLKEQAAVSLYLCTFQSWFPNFLNQGTAAPVATKICHDTMKSHFFYSMCLKLNSLGGVQRKKLSLDILIQKQTFSICFNSSSSSRKKRRYWYEMSTSQFPPFSRCSSIVAWPPEKACLFTYKNVEYIFSSLSLLHEEDILSVSWLYLPSCSSGQFSLYMNELPWHWRKCVYCFLTIESSDMTTIWTWNIGACFLHLQ